MVDEKLRQEMEQLFGSGKCKEALELSKKIDVQVMEAMREKLRNSKKRRIPVATNSEYRSF